MSVSRCIGLVLPVPIVMMAVWWVSTTDNRTRPAPNVANERGFFAPGPLHFDASRPRIHTSREHDFQPVPDFSHGAERDEAEAVDLYGNEVSDAVAKYKLDATGSLYELHSPRTEVPRLPSPKS